MVPGFAESAAHRLLPSKVGGPFPISPSSNTTYTWERQLAEIPADGTIQFGGKGCRDGSTPFGGCQLQRLDNVVVTIPDQPFFCNGNESPDYNSRTCRPHQTREQRNALWRRTDVPVKRPRRSIRARGRTTIH
eukprot:gb/GECG01010259.1/.p1 GENE.gb/GECG01010259.1/~~gb/GECG01010259.1/.p1  ORF type:complete len:133 (+),score=2.79 gb/GECG01010259.1/:1-399(+)